MNRTKVINVVAAAIAAETYLEIGTQNSDNMVAIEISDKEGVDILEASSDDYKHHQMTSDDFFDQNEKKFDIIFIDGDHSHQQSLKDFVNALQSLTENGIIIMHDANPINKEYMKPHWSGEVYKTILAIKNQGHDLFTVEEDHGVAVISQKKQDIAKHLEVDMDPNKFLEQKKELLNMISFNDIDNALEMMFSNPVEKDNSPDREDETSEDANKQEEEEPQEDANETSGDQTGPNSNDETSDPQSERREYLESMSDEELKQEHKVVFDDHVRRFDREKVIQKILDHEA